ncbi:MAG: beta-galactosidase trimerization domain-containing protein [Armatimonadota bacterium]
MRLSLLLASCLLLALGAMAQQPFKLAPAVVTEAEDFTVEKGWRPIRIGEGNYAVDIIGFSHTSGERFLYLDAKDATASAYRDINIPQAGPYRLWARYEYMPFTEARFKMVVEQNGKVVAEKVMGAKANPRTCPWSDGTKLEPQYDPPWGNEGLTEEPLDVPMLAAGPARLRVLGIEQPSIPGLTANRNLDVFYLTSDMQDEWRKHAPYNAWYGILPAIVDTLGARYEVQFTNRGDKPMNFTTGHTYNRHPWGSGDPDAGINNLAPGATSAWLPMSKQDVSHSSMARFTPSFKQPFTVVVRPVGGQVEETVVSSGEWAGIFLPPYPGKGEKASSVTDEQERIIAALQATSAPGKLPTLPLCYGASFLYHSEDNAYGRNYAQMCYLLGIRNTGFPVDDPERGLMAKTNLAKHGLGPTKSVLAMEYRLPPTDANIARYKELLTKSGALPYLRTFDYGDEISFSEWFGLLTEAKRIEQNNPKLTVEEMTLPLWQAWLKEHHKGFKPADYWRAEWGKLDVTKLRPDASAEAAAEKPRLYVDSISFYEDVSIQFVAKQAQKVRAELGQDVLTGCNWSGYPYYYPHSAMYVKWFREGAADYGKHSEYFWQLGQVTPMVNGYFSEHFRAGTRFNPKAIIRQYTMPHAPGNTSASFRRTAFTHIAHGCKGLDFFGIGMNETFTENYIDHRAADRYIDVRDITHSLGLVEDILETSQVVPSKVALLVSESTEKWDHAKIGNDHLSPAKARDFRQDRLTYHQERVGLYTALTFAGSAPDIVVDEDLLDPKIMNGYKVLFVVGDSLPVETTKALDIWVRNGGTLIATAGAGRYGAYREANPALQKLLGIQSRTIKERDTFMRTSQELPFLKPITQVAGKGWQFPALAIEERVKPVKGVLPLATFADDKSPAVFFRPIGKGRVYYMATLPGLAYLYTGLTTPEIWVPDRGPGAHREVTTYDKSAALLLDTLLANAGVQPQIISKGYLDTRLIRGKGAFILPIANYNKPDDRPVTITVRPPADAGTLVSVESAFCKQVPAKTDNDAWVITLPKLGYGDMLRINVK